MTTEFLLKQNLKGGQMNEWIVIWSGAEGMMEFLKSMNMSICITNYMEGVITSKMQSTRK